MTNAADLSLRPVSMSAFKTLAGCSIGALVLYGWISSTLGFTSPDFLKYLAAMIGAVVGVLVRVRGRPTNDRR